MEANFYRKYILARMSALQYETELLKGELKNIDGGSDETESEDEEQEDPKSKSGASKSGTKNSNGTKSSKKAPPPEEDEDAADEEDADDLDLDSDEEELDEPTKEDVTKAVKDFAKKFGKEKAQVFLKKFKVTAISDIKKADYAKAIELANKYTKGK